MGRVCAIIFKEPFNAIIKCFFTIILYEACLEFRLIVTEGKKNEQVTNVSISQFHQHLRAHFLFEFWRQSQNITGKSCRKGLLYEFFARMTLMKLTPEVNFINVFARFCTKKFWRQNFQTQNTTFVIFGTKILCKKMRA